MTTASIPSRGMTQECHAARWLVSLPSVWLGSPGSTSGLKSRPGNDAGRRSARDAASRTALTMRVTRMVAAAPEASALPARCVSTTGSHVDVLLVGPQGQTALIMSDVAAAAGVLTNDSDPDEDTLTAVLAGEPTRGTLTLAADGSFRYRASKKAKGTDSFSYLARNSTRVEPRRCRHHSITARHARDTS